MAIGASSLAFAPWTPHAKGGFLGWLTGGDRMVLRGGYSLLYDRVGFALANIFDEGGSFGMHDPAQNAPIVLRLHATAIAWNNGSILAHCPSLNQNKFARM